MAAKIEGEVETDQPEGRAHEEAGSSDSSGNQNGSGANGSGSSFEGVDTPPRQGNATPTTGKEKGDKRKKMIPQKE